MKINPVREWLVSHHNNGLLIHPGLDGSLARSGLRSSRLSISSIYFFNLFSFPSSPQPLPPWKSFLWYEDIWVFLGGSNRRGPARQTNHPIESNDPGGSALITIGNHLARKYARESYVSSHPSLRIRLPPLQHLLGFEEVASIILDTNSVIISNEN